MLRRTHMDKLFGRPILTLPPIELETIDIKFNKVERGIYNIVNERFIKRANALTMKDTPGSNYQQIFVLILRLRQLVGHPLLIQKTLKDLLEIEDIERLWSLSKDITSTSDIVGDYEPDGDEETAQALETALRVSKQRQSAKAPEMDADQRATFHKYLKTFNDSGNWAKVNARSLCNSCGSP